MLIVRKFTSFAVLRKLIKLRKCSQVHQLRSYSQAHQASQVLIDWLFSGFCFYRTAIFQKAQQVTQVVSLLPRGQWVCDKSREFCVRNEKGKRIYLKKFEKKNSRAPNGDSA